MTTASSLYKILSKTPQIGEILLKHTTLTKEQLEEALETQKKDGGFLGEILVKRKYLLPHDIQRALCIQAGILFLEDLKGHEIEPELIKDIPLHYAKAKECIPLELKKKPDGKEVLVMAFSDPFRDRTIHDLQILTGKEIEKVASTSLRIQEAINRVYERSTQNLVEDIESEFEESYDYLEGPIDILEATENDAPVIKFVNSLLFRAIKEKASDIHIEPFERDFVIRFRIDGVLFDILRQPKRAHAAIASRIKIMGDLDIAEKRLPQDGRIKIRIAGKDIDIRLSTIPTIYGERIVMRLLEQSDQILELEQLGFSSTTCQQLERLILKKYGIILVTGPTGSGKSTTLSACLSKLNSPERNILTIEDPIEYQIHGINQVQVNPKIDLTFSKALRHFLRQDPDIIMVGEIRDRETAEISINASLTGHLVISTLHTNDASTAVTRLVDMQVEPFLVASSLLAILAQRLIRKLCTYCRVAHQPSEMDLKELGLSSIPPQSQMYQHKGCPHCNQSGYSGRTVISELLLINDDLRSLIVRQSDATTLKHAAIKYGMKLLRTDGVQKVLDGITSIDELMRATQTE